MSSTRSSDSRRSRASGTIHSRCRLREIFRHLQSRLFDLGADLATPFGTPHESSVPRLQAQHAEEVERWIDEIDGQNAPLTRFVLPGGTELAARLHMARAVCRRAERRVITLQRDEPINQQTIVYLNRVGDLLFALARGANRTAGVPDVPWEATKTDK